MHAGHSARHADVLLVTGAGTVGMTGPLRTTYEGMPDPKVVIVVGTDAVSGGLGDPLPGQQAPGLAADRLSGLFLLTALVAVVAVVTALA